MCEQRVAVRQVRGLTFGIVNCPEIPGSSIFGLQSERTTKPFSIVAIPNQRRNQLFRSLVFQFVFERRGRELAVAKLFAADWFAEKVFENEFV